jgi:hypothetical protein
MKAANRGKSTDKAQTTPRPAPASNEAPAALRGRGGRRPGAGRKRIKIDLIELEKLCALQCTNAEIAAWFSCTERTIEKRTKEPEIAEVMARGLGKGRISIRRAQFKLLDAGNATMGVWLGKQYLNQRDLTPIELSGPNGSAVKFTLEAIDAILSEENTKSRKRS